jgi:UDP-glucose 4-epimerase
MKALVTGGAGFIGSHLVDRLLEDGYEVTVLDNLAVGRLSNLAAHQADPRLRFEHVDIADHQAIAPLFAGVEQVYHLAGLADIVPSVERPVDYFRANVEGTVSVLEAARNAGVRRLVYAASSSCYGLPQVFPTPESAIPSPQYPYALTKYLGEQCVMHWGQVYHMQTNSLRLFNVYGPRARTSGTYGAVFGVFLAQKLAGKPLTIVGTGEQTRDFTFVTDVVGAFVTAANSQVSGEIFNVGSGGTYSVNLLASLLGGETTSIPLRPGEPDCTFADTSKIASVLGWAPKVSFAEGVSRVLERIEDWRDAPVWTPEAIAEATRSWFEQLAPS